MEMSSVDISKLDMAVDRAGSKAELSRRLCRGTSFISNVYCNGQISMRDAKQIFMLYGINVIGKEIKDEEPIPQTKKAIKRYSRNNVAISKEKLATVIEKAGSMNKIEKAIGIEHHGYLSNVILSQRIQADAVEIIKELWGIDISEDDESEAEPAIVEGEVSTEQNDMQKQILDGINELLKMGRAQNDYLHNISVKLDEQKQVISDMRNMVTQLDGLFPAIMDQIRRKR